MDDESFARMRDYIMITEHYVQMESPSQSDVEPVLETETLHPNVCLIADLKDAIFKMRAFMESESNDEIGLGMELGMQRAADMIEHIIGRYSEANDG